VANSAVVGILRALLVADTAEFETKLGDATKDVQKFSQAMAESGATIATALDTSTDKWTKFQQKYNVGPLRDATATFAKDVGGLGTTFAEFGLRAAEFATGTLAAQLGLDAFKVVLREVVPYLLEFTGLGPAIENVWDHMKEGATRALGVLDDVGAEFRDLTDDILTGLVPGLEQVGGATGLVKIAFDAWLNHEVIQKLRDVKEYVEGIHKEWNELRAMAGRPVIPTPVAPEGETGLMGSVAQVPTLTNREQARIERELAKELAQQERDREKAARAAAAAVREEAAAFERLSQSARAISVAGVNDQIAQTNQILKMTATYGGLAADQIDKYVKQLDAWVVAGYKLPPYLEQFRLAHVDLLAAMLPVKEATKDLINLTPNLAGELRMAGDQYAGVSAKIDVFNNKINDTIDIFKILKIGAIDVIGDYEKQLAAARKKQEEFNHNIFELAGLFYDVSKTAQEFGMAATAAFTKTMEAIGGVLDSLGLVEQGLSDLAKGNVFKAVINFSYAALNGIRTLFKVFSDGHREARKSVEDFAKSFGGFDALHDKLATLGDEGERLWVQLTQGSAAQNLAAIDQIKKRFDEVATALEGARSKIGGLQSALEVFGGVVPAALRPTVDSLLSMTGLPDDIREALQGVSQDPSWQTLQSKAETLGISLEALGPKFQQARISDIAIGYTHDLQMFADSGANMDKVLEGMSDELSSLYQDAKKTGAALPDTLKPYMQKLIDAGLLVDENGNKIANLDDIAFKNMPDQALDKVVNILKEIADLLKTGLPKAAAEGAQGIQDQFKAHPLKMPYTFEQQGPGPTAPEMPTYSAADMNPGSVLEDAARGQAPIPYDAGAAEALNITVVSQLDGREVARNQVKYIPGQLNLAGV